MKKVLFSAAISIILLTGLLSCDDGETRHITNVYVAGETLTKSGKNVATYWKNQIEIPLTQDTTINSFASSIMVDGNDVHVVGYQDVDASKTGFPGEAMYWKNGDPVVLAENASAHAITVVNGNVYVAGQANIAGEIPAVYWKNGKINTLTGGNVATAIAVVGDDVYVAGVEHISTLSSIAKYWKNDVPVSLTDGSTVVYVNGIAVVGNDIYVVGIEDYLGKYWKNGVPAVLTQAAGSIEAITAVGNDIYMVGYELSSNQFINIAKYWKNGVETSITDGSHDAFANGITVCGNDIYMSGVEISEPKYWKNNQSFVLSSTRKSQYMNAVHSIFVH